jgi:para-aminobenzoate synthetase component 1
MSRTPVYLEELPYSPDSGTLFERVRDLPHALLLDSSHPHSQAGRFDILTAGPEHTFLFNFSNTSSYENLLDLFQDVARAHADIYGDISAPAEDLPFCGGIAGYLGYGLGHPLQHLSPQADAEGQLHAYTWAVVQDHLLQRCTFSALPSMDTGSRNALLDRLHQPTNPAEDPFRLQAAFQCNMTREQYREKFQQVQGYILAGDCYQVNLARMFSATCRGDSWDAYQRLRPLAGAPFSGFMECGQDRQILCLSPERFLSLYGHHVETRPIKGTRPRQRDRHSDALVAHELRQSAKDRAENLMIVDLLRNDMGRSCVPGSIHVERLFELESYPTVHHLVSTISGELLPQRNAFDLLRDCFPGGSITGAPKRRAMEIISELEADTRSAYCGSMLYVSADGRMDSNIAIRSLVCQNDEIRCWGGGGLVADSDWELEYQESWDKIGKFLNALESTLVD